MTFGDAIKSMKNLARARRVGWNGKNMYVYIKYFPSFDPCIVMHTAQGTEQPGWLANQSDILATDWEVL